MSTRSIPLPKEGTVVAGRSQDAHVIIKPKTGDEYIVEIYTPSGLIAPFPLPAAEVDEFIRACVNTYALSWAEETNWP